LTSCSVCCSNNPFFVEPLPCSVPPQGLCFYFTQTLGVASPMLLLAVPFFVSVLHSGDNEILLSFLTALFSLSVISLVLPVLPPGHPFSEEHQALSFLFFVFSPYRDVSVIRKPLLGLSPSCLFHRPCPAFLAFTYRKLIPFFSFLDSLSKPLFGQLSQFPSGLKYVFSLFFPLSISPVRLFPRIFRGTSCYPVPTCSCTPMSAFFIVSFYLYR